MWCSVTKSCLTLCNPVDCSMPAVPVLHCLLEFAQTHVHWVSWYHPTISSSVNPLSSCLQSFGSFPVSRLFASGAQSIGASASVLLMNIQGWFPLGLTGLILQSKGLSRVFSCTTIWKHQVLGTQPSLWIKSHIRTWLLKKPQLWLYGPLAKWWSLLSNTLSRFVTAFLLRSKHVLISWLPAATVHSEFGTQENKICHFAPLFPHLFYVKLWDRIPWSLFECWVLSRLFLCPLFSLTKRLFSSLLFAVRVVSSAYLRFWYFSWESWLQLELHPAQHLAWCTLHIN